MEQFREVQEVQVDRLNQMVEVLGLIRSFARRVSGLDRVRAGSREVRVSRSIFRMAIDNVFESTNSVVHNHLQSRTPLLKWLPTSRISRVSSSSCPSNPSALADMSISNYLPAIPCTFDCLQLHRASGRARPAYPRILGRRHEGTNCTRRVDQVSAGRGGQPLQALSGLGRDVHGDDPGEQGEQQEMDIWAIHGLGEKW